MNLCNGVKFDNLTLNLSVGTKLSIAECFPFAHSFITIFEILDLPKNIDLVERLKNNN